MIEIKKCADWLKSVDPAIESVVKGMQGIKSFTISNPEYNLRAFHTVLSELREKQEHIRTHVFVTMRLESQCKRLLGMAISNYKDGISKGFIEHKDKIEGARSLDEKELRLRDSVPEIKEKEDWEAAYDDLKLLREAVEFVYMDLSKAAMALNLQVNIIKQQILTGELRLAIGQDVARQVLGSELKNQPDGMFELGK
jgi:hypothetical protein